MGFSKVTALEPLAAESAELVAVIVMELEAGREAGAVYLPPLEMAPTVEDPPEMLFTDQFTAELELPNTLAVNCCEPPARTFADEGDTETVTVPDDEPVDVCDVVPVHPASSIAAIKATNLSAKRIAVQSSFSEGRVAIIVGEHHAQIYWTKVQIKVRASWITLRKGDRLGRRPLH